MRLYEYKDGSFFINGMGLGEGGFLLGETFQWILVESLVDHLEVK